MRCHEEENTSIRYTARLAFHRDSRSAHVTSSSRAGGGVSVVVGDHRAQAVSGVQRVDGGVGRRGDVPVLDGDGVRHVVVHRELAGQAPLDQFRHGAARLPATERRALPDATGDELERPRGELLPRGGDADDAGLAPASVRALQRGAHHVHVPGAVERVVHAPLGELARDHLLHGLFVVRGAHHVRAPQLRSHAELVLVQVDADDARGARHLRRLHHRQSDGA
mmetsp:Transcript_11523/g.48304  ORF Transcript_11523/g.48304 Transcript_11523/m.48304 type:complete len:223 (-) Transcript_11523:1700-2368(-)